MPRTKFICRCPLSNLTMSADSGRQFPHVEVSLAPHTVTRGCLAEVSLEGEGLWPVKVSD